MAEFINLKGQTLGDWYVMEYIGNSKWRCRNIHTNILKDIHSYSLRTKYSNHTKISKRNPSVDLVGHTFHNWKVLEYRGGGKWLCECQCKNRTQALVSTTDLRNGKSKNCSNPIHKNKEDLTDKIFGNWKVLEYVGDMRWKCECQCDKKTIKNVLTKYLINGTSKSCGCLRDNHIIHKDITGKVFGSLKVIGYSGKDNMWICDCNACNKKNVLVHRDSLVSGKTKSCGCMKEVLRKETLMLRYGDTNTLKIQSPRDEWQIRALESRENLISVLSMYECKQTTASLAIILGVNQDAVLKAVHKYSLEDYVDLNPLHSVKENGLYDYICSITSMQVIQGDRKVLNGKELDIYIPEANLAIEFNGNYWHSEAETDKLSHQYKTIECIKRGIHLIHIFEYEWDNIHLRNRLKDFIKIRLGMCNNKLYARNLRVDIVENKEVKDFLDENHIQGSCAASLAVVLYDKNDIVGVMTFGKPRFNNNFEWELVRLCFKSDTIVIGGVEKMFNYFINNYTPQSIISYCDIAKFNASVYFKLGFNTDKTCLTEPNYVWYKGNEIYSRYQTQKKKLIEYGLGTENDTEESIMLRNGFLRIYNSGTMKFYWYK